MLMVISGIAFSLFVIRHGRVAIHVPLIKQDVDIRHKA